MSRDSIVNEVAERLMQAEREGININEVLDDARVEARRQLAHKAPLFTGRDSDAFREPDAITLPTESISAGNLRSRDVIIEDRGSRLAQWTVAHVVVEASADGRRRGAYPECAVSIYVEGQDDAWARGIPGDKPFSVVRR